MEREYEMPSQFFMQASESTNTSSSTLSPTKGASKQRACTCQPYMVGLDIKAEIFIKKWVLWLVFFGISCVV
jgi:hypothetical protein